MRFKVISFRSDGLSHQGWTTIVEESETRSERKKKIFLSDIYIMIGWKKN